ncbi:protein of unknown function [Beijerinckiaceae bacterium RH AL1]|nr:hypothetical protein [Beijerinckiaceae bacterium]VVB45150.1 protein of unknown function [Beijerinckiaceae bacterium RH CH11]VVB45229.1 protein of unknown function [Beijerinckiaceae bacterium RH AL8]VVC54721.1 protein of unknown function [Beijerinckiaceae bacterium RH AL1]
MTQAGLAEADLHGLVDGRVEPSRRADVLRRLAGSAADRALVEAWQDQADLIREAFRTVAAEPLPMALDLAPPRLRSIDTTRVNAERPRGTSAATSAAKTRAGGGAAIAAALVIAIGLTMSWMAGSRDDTVVPPAAASDGAAATLPTFKVPDLSKTGLRLTEVASDADDASTLVLRFRADGGRVALRVSRNAPDIGAMPLERTDKALTWRTPTAAFSLTGTLAPERLRAVAVALQADQGSD